jgi:RES domain-containing protein
MRHADSLPVTWVAEPPGKASIEIGDAWLAKRAAPLLLVPSVIVPEEYNVLINPAHAAAAAITAQVVRQFIYDPRLK